MINFTKLKNYKIIKNLCLNNKIIEEIKKIIKEFDVDNDIIYFFEIMYILFYGSLKDKIILFDIKIGYLIKKYYFLNDEYIINILSIYNEITQTLPKLKEKLTVNIEKFINIKNNNTFNNFIQKLLLEIPIINQKFTNNEDYIDIVDYQDTIGLFYYYIYNNNICYNNVEILYEYFNSLLCAVRANNILLNNMIHSNISTSIDNDLLNQDTLDTNVKCKKYKKKYFLLKIIEKILLLSEFDKSLLINNETINDNLIAKIIKSCKNQEILKIIDSYDENNE